MGNETKAFNRVSQGVLGATGFFNLLVSVEQPTPKYLNSIFLSVVTGTGPYTFADYQIRVMVCSQIGKLNNLVNAQQFSPANVSGTDDIGDVGTIYYDQVITLPYNNPIPFDESIYFSNGERIYVTCSIPYAVGDSIVTPPNRYVRLSINGHLENSSIQRFVYR